MGYLLQQTQCPYSNDYFASKTYRLEVVLFYFNPIFSNTDTKKLFIKSDLTNLSTNKLQTV